MSRLFPSRLICFWALRSWRRFQVRQAVARCVGAVGIRGMVSECDRKKGAADLRRDSISFRSHQGREECRLIYAHYYHVFSRLEILQIQIRFHGGRRTKRNARESEHLPTWTSGSTQYQACSASCEFRWRPTCSEGQQLHQDSDSAFFFFCSISSQPILPHA